MTLNYASGNGCTVLAASLHANTSLLLLKLDGNPVGAAGAKEMVTLTLPGDDDETQVDQYDAKEAMESADAAESSDVSLDPERLASLSAGGQPESRPTSSLNDNEFAAKTEGAFAKKGKDGKLGLDVSLRDCTLGPPESNKDAMQFDEDEPAGNYELDLSRIFDRTVLRTLVKIALQKKGGFKPNTLRLDGKPFIIVPSVDFLAPTRGHLKFTYNAYSTSQLIANGKVYRALLELFETNTFNVRRDVLMDMVTKGSANLTFQQVKNLVNLTYGISVQESSAPNWPELSRRIGSSQGGSSSPSRTGTAATGKRSAAPPSREFSLQNVEEEEIFHEHLRARPSEPSGGEYANICSGESAGEEEAVYTEDDEEFAASIAQHRGDVGQIFRLMEADGDGDLSVRELKRAVERILKVSLSVCVYFRMCSSTIECVLCAI